MSRVLRVAESTAPKRTKAAPAAVEEAVGSEGFDVARFVENFEVIAEAAGGTKQLRSLVLNLAIRGKLTNRVAADGEAATLMVQIATVSRETSKARQLLGSPGPREVPFAIPGHWVWSRLGAIGRIVGGGTPKTDNPQYWADGTHKGDVAWLTPADLYVTVQPGAPCTGRRSVV